MRDRGRQHHTVERVADQGDPGDRRPVQEPRIARQKRPRRPGERRIAAVFEAGIAAARAGDGRGCLLCNTAGGPALAEAGVREAVTRQLDDLTDGFAAALTDTERWRTADPTERLAEARRLTLAYVGLRVLGRGGAAPTMLEDAVARVLAA